MADERQPFKMRGTVGTVAVLTANRSGQQPGFLVIADGFDIDARGLPQFTDAQRGFHRRASKAATAALYLLDPGAATGCAMQT